jgi:hypothetical protein
LAEELFSIWALSRRLARKPEPFSLAQPISFSMLAAIDFIFILARVEI